MDATPQNSTKHCVLCDMSFRAPCNLREHLNTAQHAKVAAAVDRATVELQERCTQQTQRIQQLQEAVAALGSARVPAEADNAADGRAVQENCRLSTLVEESPGDIFNDLQHAFSTGLRLGSRNRPRSVAPLQAYPIPISPPAPGASHAIALAPAVCRLPRRSPVTPAPQLEFSCATIEPSQVQAQASSSDVEQQSEALQQVDTLQLAALSEGQNLDLPAQAGPSSSHADQQATDISEGPYQNSLGSVLEAQQPTAAYTAAGRDQTHANESASAQPASAIGNHPQQTHDSSPARSEHNTPASATGSGHRAPASTGDKLLCVSLSVDCGRLLQTFMADYFHN